jgi:hypothetical protein
MGRGETEAARFPVLHIPAFMVTFFCSTKSIAGGWGVSKRQVKPKTGMAYLDTVLDASHLGCGIDWWTELRRDSVCPHSGHVAHGQTLGTRTASAVRVLGGAERGLSSNRSACIDNGACVCPTPESGGALRVETTRGPERGWVDRVAPRLCLPA